MADEDSTPEMEFFNNLGKLQTDFCLNTSLEEALPMSTRWGFSMQVIATNDSVSVTLNHYKGHSIVSCANQCGIGAAAAGLLGLPTILGCEGPPAHLVTEPKPKPEPAPAAPPAAPAASEPATFDLEEDLPEAPPANPDPEADPSTSTAPLSADQKATIVAMLRALTPEKKRAANVAFRKAFNIPSSITSPSDAITEVRHLEYLQRLVDEAEGIPSP